MRINCNCCSKQIINDFHTNKVSKFDEYLTTSIGSVRDCVGYICGHCAEDLDENGLFPEER